MYNIPYYCCSQ